VFLPGNPPNPETMMNLLKALGATLFALGLSACASMGAPTAPAKVSDGVFVNASGMTLYTFDRDMAGSGKSVCNGPCATNWPPLVAGADAKDSGDWTVVKRDDGTPQWAYKGKPLYTWSKDAKPGDRTGDGFNNAWRLARP
jgi:predicted lipoprotein with Yx(FWY)xxD motif